jgi:hypothetical protein
MTRKIVFLEDNRRNSGSEGTLKCYLSGEQTPKSGPDPRHVKASPCQGAGPNPFND